MPGSRLQAVLTGDIVGSSELEAIRRSQLPDLLRRAFERSVSFSEGPFGAQFDVFRGDAWQLHLTQPEHALRVGIAFRAYLRTEEDVDARFALAIDTVDFVDTDRVSQSDGAAFRRSGRALDALSGRSMACLLPERYAETPHQRLFDAIASATGAFIDRWTPPQAQAVLLTLTLPATRAFAGQAQVAAAWPSAPVSQQAVSGHLRKAQWSEIEQYLASFATEVRQIEEEEAS